MISANKVVRRCTFPLAATGFCYLCMCLLAFPHVVFSTELSDYIDCANSSRSDSTDGVPLTKAERISNLEADYVRVVSRTERCSKSEESANSSSSGDAAGGESATGGAGSAGSTQTLSKNAGATNNDIKVNSTLKSVASRPPSAVLGNVSTSTHSGKDHEELEAVDNKAILRAQIKAAADEETDPEMKKILTEKYESLK